MVGLLRIGVSPVYIRSPFLGIFFKNISPLLWLFSSCPSGTIYSIQGIFCWVNYPWIVRHQKISRQQKSRHKIFFICMICKYATLWLLASSVSFLCKLRLYISQISNLGHVIFFITWNHFSSLYQFLRLFNPPWSNWEVPALIVLLSVLKNCLQGSQTSTHQQFQLLFSSKCNLFESSV